MVIVEVLGCGVEEDPPPEDPPPQADSRLNPAKPTVSTRRSCTLRRFLQPSRHRANANAAPGTSGREFRFEADAPVATVSVVFAAVVPEGVTVAGEKLHAAPAGKPLHANVTAELKPFCGVTDTATAPLCPAVTVTAAGETPTLKDGGGRLIV